MVKAEIRLWYFCSQMRNCRSFHCGDFQFWNIATVQMPAGHGTSHSGAALLRRTSVFAGGENFGAGAIHLPRAFPSPKGGANRPAAKPKKERHDCVVSFFLCDHDDNGYRYPYFYIISYFDTLAPIFTNSDTDNLICTIFCFFDTDNLNCTSFIDTKAQRNFSMVITLIVRHYSQLLDYSYLNNKFEPIHSDCAPWSPWSIISSDLRKLYIILSNAPFFHKPQFRVRNAPKMLREK